MLLLAGMGIAQAQDAPDTASVVQGRVTDAWGRPAGEVTVRTENGRNGTSTGAAGRYSISIDDGSSALVFSGAGYVSQRIEINGEKQLDVQLQDDVFRQDDLVHLGYTSRRRAEISGAVATVTGEELEKSPVANLSQAFAGRLAGLTTREVYSELSRAQTDLFIRGLSSARRTDPLVVIDGIISSYQSNQTLEYISAGEIESITLLKDASTQALYGIQGASGVLVITTKRGRKGKLQINGRLDQSIQQVTTKPTFYGAAEYAEMRNQAAYNDGLGEHYLFTQEQIDQYRLGTDPERYPDNNWYDYFMKDFASMQRLGVNVTGGGDKVQFFSNLNLMHQGGQFKTDQTRYNPAPNNYWINYRTNVDMNLNRYLKAFVRLSGNVKREHTPGASNDTIYSSIFRMPPTMYGPVTPPVTDPGTGEVLAAGGQVVTTERVDSPAYGMLNRSGYMNHTVTNINSQFGLDLDMDFLTSGLSLSGVFAYQTNSVGSLKTLQDYERWVRTGDAGELSFQKIGSQVNSPLAYSKDHQYYYHLTYKTVLSYQRTFGKHRLGGMGYAFYQNLTKADTASPWLLPYNRFSSGAELAYGYDNRYFLKAVAGYSGSEQYARHKRYVTTPAISAAWVVSNERFAQDAGWLDLLKLRVSWGKTASDQSGLVRFAYLDNVTFSRGGPIGSLQWMVNEYEVGNPDIQAEISTKQNYGIDLGLFDALSLSVDVFRERMDNMVVDALATIPLYQGVPLQYYPAVNEGSFGNKGYEITARYTKTLGRNFSLFAGGMFSYAKNTVLDWNEALKTEDYAYRKWEEGYSYGQQFGYLVDYTGGNGFFNSQQELDNSGLDYGFGEPRVGDLKYRDLNADGKIDERDKAPVGTGLIPRVTYAFSGGVTYKSFELSLLFQGVGQYATMLEGTGIWETEFDGVFGALHLQAWTQERYDNGEPITWPALSLAKTVNHEPSDFVLYDRSYLRLKNLELAYTLPQPVSEAIRAEKVRCIFSGQNLLTRDKMKSDDFGPEGGGYASFPVYRVYSLGVQVIF